MSKKKKAIFTSIILIIITIIVVTIINKNNKKETYTTTKTKIEKLIQTVSETGTIKASSEIELHFLNTGKINKKYFNISDQIKKGDIIAELDYTDLIIKKIEAEANLNIAKANSEKTLTGATSYQINTNKAQTNQATVSYESAINELEKTEASVKESINQAKQNKISDIGNKKDTALTYIEINLSINKIALDKINNILDDDDIKNFLGQKNSSQLNYTKNKYSNVLKKHNNAIITLNTTKLNPSDKNVNNSLNTSIKSLGEVFVLLNDTYSTLENSIISSTFTQTELDALKTTINTQITSISSSMSSIQTAQQNLDSAILTMNNSLNTAIRSGDQQLAIAQSKVDSTKELLNVSQAQLKEVTAPPRNEDVKLSKAKIKQAQAALDYINNQIQNSIIKSPIDGILTKFEYEIGEQVSPTKYVAAVLGDSKLEVEVDISETDITKLTVGDKTEIILDALGDELKFYGNIYSIEPAETVIQDVIYYKVKINFEENQKLNENIKPGMTANLEITTASKNNTLVIPYRAIIEKNGSGKFVRILDEKGDVKEISIETGLYGDDGMIEIISGLENEQEIVTYINTK